MLIGFCNRKKRTVQWKHGAPAFRVFEAWNLLSSSQASRNQGPRSAGITLLFPNPKPFKREQRQETGSRDKLSYNKIPKSELQMPKPLLEYC